MSTQLVCPSCSSTSFDICYEITHTYNNTGKVFVDTSSDYWGEEEEYEPPEDEPDREWLETIHSGLNKEFCEGAGEGTAVVNGWLTDDGDCEDTPSATEITCSDCGYSLLRAYRFEVKE